MISFPEIREEIFKVYETLDDNKKEEFRKKIRDKTEKVVSVAQSLFSIVNLCLPRDLQIYLEDLQIYKLYLLNTKIDLVGISILEKKCKDMEFRIRLQDEKIIDNFNKTDITLIDEVAHDNIEKSLIEGNKILNLEINNMVEEINKIIEESYVV